MPKTSATKDAYRKYVLVDKPMFSKGKEGLKFLFKREENQSYAFAVKKFFLKPLMRAEAKKQIINILKSPIFESSNNARDLLEKIKAIPFWKGVKTEEFLTISKPALMRAALEKNDVFCKPDKTASAAEQQNLLRDLLGAEFPDLLRDFDTYQKKYRNHRYSDENDKYVLADDCEEEFSSFEYEEDTLTDESNESDASNVVENENFIEHTNTQIDRMAEKHTLAISNKIFEAPSPHKAHKTTPKEKELIKQNQQEYFQKENDQLKII